MKHTKRKYNVKTMNEHKNQKDRFCGKISEVTRTGIFKTMINRLNILFKMPFLKKISFIFRVRGSEGKRAGEKHQCVVASHAPPNGDQACALTGN